MGIGVIKIAIVGAESTGKSCLATALAKHYNTIFVPECARHLLEKTKGLYQEQDLIEFAKAQMAAENDAHTQANRIIFCDTDIANIRIWSEVKYGRCALELLNLNVNCNYNAALLCDIDLPWQADELRENPDDNIRKQLQLMYLDDLQSNNTNFKLITGSGDLRLHAAVAFIDKLLKLYLQ
jgi:NadR type nicotinamide-nucleotide adenylyltransferase